MRRLVIWVLKTFWFPILLFVLAKLSDRYPWANTAHTKLKKFK